MYMKQTTSRKASALLFERNYAKSYMKLLIQQASNTAQKVDNYFFNEDGSDDELKICFYGSIIFPISVLFFIFITIN